MDGGGGITDEEREVECNGAGSVAESEDEALAFISRFKLADANTDDFFLLLFLLVKAQVLALTFLADAGTNAPTSPGIAGTAGDNSTSSTVMVFLMVRAPPPNTPSSTS